MVDVPVKEAPIVVCLLNLPSICLLRLPDLLGWWFFEWVPRPPGVRKTEGALQLGESMVLHGKLRAYLTHHRLRVDSKQMFVLGDHGHGIRIRQCVQ